jgi:hypothetical protein
MFGRLRDDAADKNVACDSLACVALIILLLHYDRVDHEIFALTLAFVCANANITR